MSTRAVPDLDEPSASPEPEQAEGKAKEASVGAADSIARRAAEASSKDVAEQTDPVLFDPSTRDTWLALIALLIIGCAMLFYNYGNDQFYRWDEGLYGQFARNALAYGDYTIPLDTHGTYAKEPFSKPPLSFVAVALSFKAFGATIYALRLPFSLSVLALSLICFFWGKQLGTTPRQGTWLGFAWAASLVLSDATLKWGRTAAIEPMFVLFLTAALFCQSRAVVGRARYGWSLATGTALMLAFFTKQLAFGLAALPIALLELAQLRRLGLKRVSLRALLLASPTLLCGSLWFYQAYLEAGEPLVRMLIGFALAERFAGFSGTMHFNSLNRVSQMLDDVSEPFSWQMGALGLALLVLVSVWTRRERPRREPSSRELPPPEPVATPSEQSTQSGASPDAAASPKLEAQAEGPAGILFEELRASALLLGLFLLTSTFMIELAAKSTLPWYTYSFLVPLTLGGAWLMAGVPIYALDRLRPTTEASDSVYPDWLPPARAALGAATVLLAIDRGWLKFGSQLGVVTLGLSAAIAVTVAARRWPGLSSLLKRRASVAACCGAVALLLLASRSRSFFFYRETSPMSQLMNAVAKEGANRVAIDPDIADWDPKYYEITTLFGSAATVSHPPWEKGNLQGFDAYVEFRVLPMELHPPAGMRLFRTSRAVAWFGDLKQAPYPPDPISELLEKGPVTFEAEHQESERKEGLQRDRLASGGLARGFVPWLSQAMKEHAVTEGPIGVFPPGEYTAYFFVRYSCGSQRGARVGYVSMEGSDKTHKKELACDGANHDGAYQPIKLGFTLDAATELEPTVVYRRGRGRLWHDRTQIRKHSSEKHPQPKSRDLDAPVDGESPETE